MREVSSALATNTSVARNARIEAGAGGVDGTTSLLILPAVTATTSAAAAAATAAITTYSTTTVNIYSRSYSGYDIGGRLEDAVYPF